MTEGLEVRDLTLHHRNTVQVAVSFSVPPAEVLTLMGPSGVGKSTLLSAISGQLAPEFRLSGSLWLNGRDITTQPAAERRVGILFQDHLLFPHLSVGGNLAFGLSPEVPRSQRRARTETALAQIGLPGHYDRDPATLSGGQKARVALMRMLLAEPDLLLLDEPFSGLDTTLRAQIRELVFSTARSRGLPVVLVTHDSQDAEAAAGPVIHLQPPSAG